jgi:hypothetical protein
MKTLEQLLKKTTPYSPKKYCERYGKNVSDYVGIHMHYFWPTNSEEKVLEKMFSKHPDAETLSSFKKKRYGDYTSYKGILLVPRT